MHWTPNYQPRTSSCTITVPSSSLYRRYAVNSINCCIAAPSHAPSPQQPVASIWDVNHWIQLRRQKRYHQCTITAPSRVPSLVPSPHHHCTITAPSLSGSVSCSAKRIPRSWYHHCSPSLHRAADDSYHGDNIPQTKAPSLRTITAPSLHKVPSETQGYEPETTPGNSILEGAVTLCHH